MSILFNRSWIAIALSVCVISLTAPAEAEDARLADITVWGKLQATSVVHASKSTPARRLALGDRVIRRHALFNERNRPIGTLYSECVNVGRMVALSDATLQCTATYLFGNGQIAVSGLMRLVGGWPGPSVAIVGGAGQFHGARGTLEQGRPVHGYDIVHSLHPER